MYKKEDIEYDKEIEVSKEAYEEARNYLAGIILSREENGKYYLKLWFMKYTDFLLEIVNKFPL